MKAQLGRAQRERDPGTTPAAHATLERHLHAVLSVAGLGARDVLKGFDQRMQRPARFASSLQWEPSRR